MADRGRNSPGGPLAERPPGKPPDTSRQGGCDLWCSRGVRAARTSRSSSALRLARTGAARRCRSLASLIILTQTAAESRRRSPLTSKHPISRCFAPLCRAKVAGRLLSFGGGARGMTTWLYRLVGGQRQQQDERNPRRDPSLTLVVGVSDSPSDGSSMHLNQPSFWDR